MTNRVPQIRTRVYSLTIGHAPCVFFDRPLTDTAQSDFPAYTHSPDTKHSNSSLESDTLPYPSDDHPYQSRRKKPISMKDNQPSRNPTQSTDTHIKKRNLLSDKLTSAAVSLGILTVSHLPKKESPLKITPAVNQSIQTKDHPLSTTNKTFHLIKSFLYSSLFTFILTIISWCIVCWAIDNNLWAGLNTLIPKLHLLLILLIPALVTSLATLPALSSGTKNSQPLIELKYSNQEKNQHDGEIREFVSRHLKIFNSIAPMSVAISFTFVLYHYREITSGDLGLALQITSMQFPEQKITWITVMFVYLSIFYISLLPAIILSQINSPNMNLDIHRHIFKDGPIKLAKYYSYLATQAALLAIASNFIILYILKITTNGGTAETLLFTISLSMTACTFPILNIIKQNNTNNENMSSEIGHNKGVARLFTGILAILILLISYLSPALLLEYMPKSIGGIVANPGTTVETNEIDYACVFPSGENNPKSIAFGIVISSDNSSIHLFTPSYDTKNKRYAELLKDGHKKPNKLIESRIKYTNGFYIEKYDRNIHVYNENSGQCEYKNSK